MKVISYIFFGIGIVLVANRLSAQPMDSLDIKIGQMILIGVPGTSADPTVLKEIREGKAGSIIFFEKNIAAKNSYEQLKRMAWTYQSAAPIPLFVSIDQEGGRVNRLKEKYGFPKSLSASAMGQSLDSVRYYGLSTAATLAGLGINVNFAPVVDLASNPDNPVIAKVERSFSSNADTVALYAGEFIKTHRQTGVITSLKHFPGHGSSEDDTHLGMADVTRTWSEEELIPYRKIIDGGYVNAIMTAHIVNKRLDRKGLPGTLSSSIIDSLLRNQLHFNGVVFSDDMQMHAITKHYGLEEAIKLAVNAGVDILTFSNNIQGSEERTVDKVHSIIKKFVKDGTIPKERIDESFRRIMLLKRRLNQEDVDFYREELLRREMELNRLRTQMSGMTILPEKEEQTTQETEQPRKEKKKKKKKN